MKDDNQRDDRQDLLAACAELRWLHTTLLCLVPEKPKAITWERGVEILNHLQDNRDKIVHAASRDAGKEFIECLRHALFLNRKWAKKRNELLGVLGLHEKTTRKKEAEEWVAVARDEAAVDFCDLLEKHSIDSSNIDGDEDPIFIIAEWTAQKIMEGNRRILELKEALTSTLDALEDEVKMHHGGKEDVWFSIRKRAKENLCPEE